MSVSSVWDIRRVFARGFILLAIHTGFGSGLAQDSVAAREFEAQTSMLWAPYQSWSLPMFGHDGNPYDVVATATFVHESGHERRVTPLFYAGDGAWSFRFTATRTGTWRISTHSTHDALDGWHGEVRVAPNPDPDAHGFLTTSGRRFAVPVDEFGTMRARLYNVYMDPSLMNSVDDLPTDPDALAARVDAVLDGMEAHGFDAIFLAVNNNWFEFGASAHTDHTSVDPSPTTFEILEAVVLRAFERGASVHLWAWGDEERFWTPIGVGGIGGEADLRLQRYIAGRLGPLPGWSMSYGFDLDEWVTPVQTRDWWTHMHVHLAWPHLLMARESATTVRDPDLVFRFDGPPLDVHSSDARPVRNFYAAARSILARSDVPAIFERRFLHTRDGVWDQDTTRRALWQFTLAGGAGAIWGPLWEGGSPYSEPDVLRTHGTFWRDRWALDLEPPPNGANPTDSVYRLVSTDGGRAVIYAEGTAMVPLDLTHLAAGAHRVVAVDTREPYAEIDLGRLDPAGATWSAPHVSDWVVAVGFE